MAEKEELMLLKVFGAFNLIIALALLWLTSEIVTWEVFLVAISTIFLVLSWLIWVLYIYLKNIEELRKELHSLELKIELSKKEGE